MRKGHRIAQDFYSLLDELTHLNGCTLRIAFSNTEDEALHKYLHVGNPNLSQQIVRFLALARGRYAARLLVCQTEYATGGVRMTIDIERRLPGNAYRLFGTLALTGDMLLLTPEDDRHTCLTRWIEDRIEIQST